VESTFQVAPRGEGRAGNLRVAAALLVDRSTSQTEDIMATCTDIAHSANANGSGLLRLGAVVARAWNGYWEYRANRAAVALLQSLDPQALRDMGINHGDIESVVYGQREDTRR
jgi:uncharacterized protein YjiS (DUF1127 family)